MPVTSSAIYGTAKYGQARYGRVLRLGSTNFIFSVDGFANITVPITAQSAITFTTNGSPTYYRLASGLSTFTFSEQASLYADGILSGSLTTTFSFTVNPTRHEAPYEYNNVPGTVIYNFNSGTLGPPFLQYNVINTKKPFEEEN